MWTALNTLGYTPYHFKEVKKNIQDRHLFCWREALIAKLYGSGKPYGKADFDKLLQHYDAVTDAPAVNFSEELIAAYPDAKVILTKRDPNKWLASILRSYHAVIESKVFRVAAAMDPGFSMLEEVLRLVLCHWTGGDWRNRDKLIEGYHAHNELIRDIVPPENLLEWAPEDGWEPICKFLEKPIPEEPFPHSHKGDRVAEGLTMAARLRLAKGVLQTAVVPVLLTSVACGCLLLEYGGPYWAGVKSVVGSKMGSSWPWILFGTPIVVLKTWSYVTNR
ncbi:Hypothetical predicted protein [Lecanosticta acicola]|uniref:Uncharacterized protein n=1 Tax=Lecanosticta acicola TaxID=111012 RepID=A0AAI9EBP4_9PEZI|nr:Hypothetical predicted protein [Lecanosticta acicola]